MKKLFNRIVDIFNAVAILALILAYLAPYIDPEDFWPVAFFGLTFKVWALINILLLVLWIFRGKRRWMYNAFFLLIGSQFLARNIQFNAAKDKSHDFTVASFNTNVQEIYHSGNSTKKINSFLVEKQYDIVLLVEWMDNKGGISKEAYPHQQFVKLSNHFGLKLLSKHKIINWERITYDHFTGNMSAYFDLEIDGEMVRFFGTHLQTNRISSADYHTLIDVKLDDEYKDYALNVFTRLRKNILLRSNQTKTIISAINQSPYPVIILGDFNDTPQSYTYQKLKEGRKDAFIETGNGWGATFLKPFPLLRIDYILHDPELECTGYQCLTPVKSDHALVEASFKLKN